MSPQTTFTWRAVPSSSSAEATTASRLSTVTLAPASSTALTSQLPSSPYAPVTNTDLPLRACGLTGGEGAGRAAWQRHYGDASGGDLLVQRGQIRIAAGGPTGALKRGDLRLRRLPGGREDRLDTGAGGAVAGD